MSEIEQGAEYVYRFGITTLAFNSFLDEAKKGG